MTPRGTTQRIVAMGGGGFSMEPDNPLLDDFLLSLVAGRRRPRVCFLPTAAGDAADYVVRFYQAFTRRECVPTHLSLFRRTVSDLDALLAEQDLVYVGGGNVVNLLAVWRAHGVDQALRRALERGTVLCGLSAGSLCWYEGGTTDSLGPGLNPLRDGLGWLAGSHSPHYDGEPGRRPLYQRLVQEGALPPGLAADDGVALLYEDGVLVRTVSSRPEAKAWRVEPGAAEARETAIEPELLGGPDRR